MPMAKKELTPLQLIQNYMKRQDLPKWYREVSIFQVEAGRSVLNAIRDDLEENTFFRTKECLTNIGLTNIPAGSILKLVMKLSRGNDLAFLWFLMELHYKTNGKGYSLEEQLIMSTIAGLDMITTLRELDRMLPPSSMSKKAWEKRQQSNNNRNKRKKIHKEKCRYPLPYFEPLERRKPKYNQEDVSRPKFPVNFGIYNMIHDPFYEVPNEFNRWYENYPIEPGKRIVYNILRDTVGEIFEDSESIDDSGSQKIKGICEHHQKMVEMRALLQAELTVLTRQKIEEHMDLVKEEREERRKKFTVQLENDVHEYMEKFRKRAEKTDNHLLAMKIDSKSNCHYCLEKKSSEICEPVKEKKTEVEPEPEQIEESVPIDSTVKSGRETGRKSSKLSVSQLGDGTQKRSSSRKSRKLSDTKLAAGRKPSKSSVTNLAAGRKPSKSSVISLAARRKSSKLSIAEDRKTTASFDAKQGHKTKQAFKRKASLSEGTKQSEENAGVAVKRLSKVQINIEDISLVDSICNRAVVPAIKECEPGESYFKPNYENKPHVFDYRKIFYFKTELSETAQIRKAIFEALQDQVKYPENVPTSRIDLQQPVDICADKMWQEGVQAKNAELDALARAKVEQEERDLQKFGFVLRYDVPYYDPTNKKFMRQMLSDAFRVMKKNPKFVLASMPDSHKLPILLEWIKWRYGWKYDPEIIAKDISYLRILRLLENRPLRVRCPDLREMGHHLMANYSCREYVIQKATQIRQKYFDTFDKCMLRFVHRFWCASRPYQCVQGPPQTTFFSYMASSKAGINHYGVWKPSEFRNFHLHWLRRLRGERGL